MGRNRSEVAHDLALSLGSIVVEAIDAQACDLGLVDGFRSDPIHAGSDITGGITAPSRLAQAMTVSATPRIPGPSGASTGSVFSRTRW